LRMTFPNLGDWTSPQSEPESKAKRTPKFIPRSTSGCVARVCTLYPWSGFRIPASPGPSSEVDFLWYHVIMYIMKNIYHHISIYLMLFEYVFPYILHVSIHKYAMRFEYFYHYHYISIIINWLCLIMISINWLSLSWSINLSLMIDFV
jgi:hypothetical protein